MTRLLARSPAEGMLPFTRGTVTLAERQPEAITSIAPFRGQEAAVSKALKTTIGVAFPKPGRTEAKGETACLWSGHGQALLLGPAPGPVEGAATTDQSDAWTCLALEGPDAEAILARLVPLDLRATVFPKSAAARSILFHMPLAIRRTGPSAFELLVYRSMTATAIHEIEQAMISVAAQSA